tara:strand:- start:355 stop:1116 length:762 start_codon:yes stop_codon:yes gene_type:complete
MVARLGATESKAVIYPKIPKFFKPLVKNTIFKRIHVWSGFFPVNEENIKKFSILYKNELDNTDILASWRIEEKLMPEIKKIKNIINLRDLEAYYSNDPWTKLLYDKKVLIVHPFSETIIKQYKNREKIFANQDILPEFQIDTVKAVQSLSGEDQRFKSWFDALEYMKNEMSKKTFDIALIGCGAYGLPLAGHAKRLGKIGIHLGGSLQLLFGIKGKRWDNDPQVNKFYNDYWVRPSENDKPKNYLKVEDGCYW